MMWSNSLLSSIGSYCPIVVFVTFGLLGFKCFNILGEWITVFGHNSLMICSSSLFLCKWHKCPPTLCMFILYVFVLYTCFISSQYICRFLFMCLCKRHKCPLPYNIYTTCMFLKYVASTSIKEYFQTNALIYQFDKICYILFHLKSL